ncbi:MAG: helix-turn-helix transcriptional regulator [Bacillota bacterium]|jgi:transcriptional regulator with XRE-family HTH domain
MSYAIGRKIKEVRTNLKISQEDMAGVLETTRQRYARLENGQIDLSYVVIKKIADHFGVPTRTLTAVEDEPKGLVTLFREKNSHSDVVESVAVIEEILTVFHAHEKLYHQMRERNNHED